MRGARSTLMLLLLVVAAATATGAGAQEADWRPGDGDRSLAFALPDGGGAIGWWWHGADGRATGLELAVDAEASLRTGGASPDQFGSGVRVSLGPSFKRYRDDRGPVSPYSMWGVGVTGGFDYLAVDDPGTDDQASWLAGVYGKLGLGVDWFPLERVSIGGHVALRLAYELVTGSGDAPTEHAVRLDARSSAIVVHWYF